MSLKIVKIVIILLLVCIATFLFMKVNKFSRKLFKSKEIASEILFEVKNESMVGAKDLDIRYIAGLASSKNSKAIFKQIDIYQIQADGSKVLISTKKVEYPLMTTFNDYYKNSKGESKQIKNAEPSLKEAISFHVGWEINEFNSPVIKKCFESLPISNVFDGSYIQLDLSKVFTNKKKGDEYTLLFDGVFSLEKETLEQHFERTLKIYY